MVRLADTHLYSSTWRYPFGDNRGVRTAWRELASYNKLPTQETADGTVLHIPTKRPYTITLPDGSVYVVSGEDESLLARLVHAEARGEPLEGKIAVAAVVLNRLRSTEFPNSIREIIYDPGQFTPVEGNDLPAKADETTGRR